MANMIASQAQTHLRRRGYSPVWYVCSLPGCTTGNKRAPIGSSERNCDWGWTSDRSKAFPLSPYWQRRFMKFSRDINREGKLEAV